MILDNSINYDKIWTKYLFPYQINIEITLRYDTIVFFPFQKAQTFTHTKEIEYTY